MEFRIPKASLIEALQTAHPVVTERSSLPILSHLLVKAEEGKVRLLGTDLELGIICEASAEIKETGALTVPGKRLMEIVRELPEAEVLVRSKKNQVMTLECGQVYFKIMGLSPEEFPQLPEFSEEPTLTLPQELFKAMLRVTAFAISKDETRYVLNGILVRVRGQQLRLVATDGRRLAMVEQSVETLGKSDHEIIIPAKAVQELFRLLGDEGTMELRIRQNQVAFALGATQVISRLIEGAFPDYEQVIPKMSERKFTIDRERFLSAARRAGILATQASPSIKLDLVKDKLVISKEAPEIGESRDEVEIVYRGESMTVGFNPTYLTDVLKHVERPEIDFELTGPESPGVLRIDGNYVYLVLPMQV